METSASKFICVHEELACCSISISVPVSSTKSQKLSLQVCPNCAASMASQGDMPGFDADPVAVMQSLFATFVSANRSSSSSACVDMHTHTRARASTRTHALLRLSDGGASSSGFTTCW